LIFVVAGLVSICMNGCASSLVTITSRTEAPDVAPLKRLLVVANVDPASFTGLMHRSFDSTWMDRLNACGVQSAILNSTAMDINIEKNLVAAAQAFQPNAILMIRSAGGQVWINRDQRSVRFEMKIIDVETQKTTWMASSVLEISAGYMTDQQRQEVGANFASSILSRLRHDSVLTSCPATLKWPLVRQLVEDHAP
jgi:hypothetical protein